MCRRILIALACLGLIAASVSSASASNRKSRVVAAARKAMRSEDEFIRKFNKLSALEQANVRKALQDLSLEDSDSDGVPNIVENSQGTDSCKEDSDDDGSSDDAEREAHGKISAVADNSITVGGLVFAIDENTQFEGIAREALAVDVCVEAEGSLAADIIVASKIEASDNCDSGHNGHHGE